MRVQRYIVLILASMLIQTSCGFASPEKKKVKHKERGVSYYENNKLQEALIEFANAVQIDPQDSDAHYRLAQTYVRLGGEANLIAAFRELSRTVEIDPSHRQAQLLLGALHLLGNEPEKALERADIVLAASPNDAEGLELRATSLVRKMDYRSGIAAYGKAIEQNATNTSLHIGLAQAYVAAQDYAGAEQTLQRALSTMPESPELWLALGDFHQLRGSPEKAEEAFRRGIAIAPHNEALSLKLAQYYLRNQRTSEAEAVYLGLAKANPANEKYLVLLGDFYFSIGDQQQALQSFIRATQLNASSAMARDKLIGYYMDIGETAEAERLVKTALEKDPKDYTARLLDARLRLAQGKTEELLVPLRNLVKEQPASPMAHEVLGLALLYANMLHEAQTELEESVRLAPQALGPRIQLTRALLAQHSYDLAAQQAETVLTLNPRNALAAFLLGEAYRAKGDLSKAQSTFEALAKIAPDYPGLHYRRGLIERAQRRNGEAIKHFEADLKSNPKSFESLAEIMAINMQEGKATEVRDRITRQMQLVPDSPTLYHLLGQYWMAVRENAKAVEAYKKAIDLDPNLFPAYISLGELYQRGGQLEDAEREYQSALEKNPSLGQAHMLLGMIEENRKSYDKAKAHYEQALAVMPRLAPAANNLAWLLIEHGGNSDIALAHAQKAREIRPDDPTIADTLGWIYYKKNVPLRATNLLREAAEKLKNNPVVQYHYGMALALKGEHARARSVLSNALQLSQTFPGAEEARKKLMELDQPKKT